MRSALRGTEVIPPADGWARLERELGPHPRISVLRSHWPRIAAAAAAVLIFLGGGGYLLHENRDLGDKGFVIATATDSGSSAADMAQVDGTPAGDGEGTLAGALRAAVPTEEAVRAAALPGEEPGAGTAPGIAPGRNALAAADMRGFEDGRAAALTSGLRPPGRRLLQTPSPVIRLRKMRWQGARLPERPPQRLLLPGMPRRTARGRPCVRQSPDRRPPRTGTREKRLPGRPFSPANTRARTITWPMACRNTGVPGARLRFRSSPQAV